MRTELLSVAAAAATVVLLLYSRRRKPVPRKAAEPSRPPSSPLSHTIQPRCLVIGVAGGSGSGKSCFTAMLKRMCENVPGCWSCLIEHDRYYKDKEQVEAECGGDWDCPEALHTRDLLADIRRLAAGEAIRLPHYDFSVSRRATARATVLRPSIDEPLVVIIVEGLMLFHDASVRAAFDLRFFIDCDEDTRFMRRLARDTAHEDVGGRGRSVASVFKQWADDVKPAHHRYIEPCKRYAHLIVPSRGLNVPTHLRRTGCEHAPEHDERGLQIAEHEAEEAMMGPALRLLEAFVARASSEAAAMNMESNTAKASPHCNSV